MNNKDQFNEISKNTNSQKMSAPVVSQKMVWSSCNRKCVIRNVKGKQGCAVFTFGVIELFRIKYLPNIAARSNEKNE